MNYTFVVADLHGRLDLLEIAIQRIESQYDGGTIVFTGDYVDRGTDSRGVVQMLMEGPKNPDHWDWVCLKGNHEAMQIGWSKHQISHGLYLQNGGGMTLLSYGADHPNTEKNVLDPAHLGWMTSLPIYYADAYRVYVHAFISPRHSVAEQDDHDMIWTIWPIDADDPWTGHPDGKERHIVHGHEQFADGPKLYTWRTNLDTFAWYTGKLVVGVFDDKVRGGPVDAIVVQGLSETERLHNELIDYVTEKT